MLERKCRNRKSRTQTPRFESWSDARGSLKSEGFSFSFSKVWRRRVLWRVDKTLLSWYRLIVVYHDSGGAEAGRRGSRQTGEGEGQRTAASPGVAKSGATRAVFCLFACLSCCLLAGGGPVFGARRRATQRGSRAACGDWPSRRRRAPSASTGPGHAQRSRTPRGWLIVSYVTTAVRPARCGNGAGAAGLPARRPPWAYQSPPRPPR